MKEQARRVSTQMLAAYVDGEVTPSEAQRIEAELADSAARRRELAELRRIQDALSSPVPQLEGEDLVPGLRERIAASSGSEPRRLPRWSTWAASACVAAAAAALLISRINPAAAPESGDGFRAKAGESSRDERARWAGIHAYSVIDDAEPQALAESISRRAGLLFSYSNLGPKPFDYLMIFATDARGEVHWCYPAYQRAGSDPSAPRIRKGEARVPLPELIRLDLAPGPATLHALFTERPLRVSEVEAWLRRTAGDRTQRLPGTYERVLQLEVLP